MKTIVEIVAASALASLAFGELLPVEIYEKGNGDIDRSERYSIAELVRETGVETADFKLRRRLIKVTNQSNETRTWLCAARL